MPDRRTTLRQINREDTKLRAFIKMQYNRFIRWLISPRLSKANAAAVGIVVLALASILALAAFALQPSTRPPDQSLVQPAGFVVASTTTTSAAPTTASIAAAPATTAASSLSTSEATDIAPPTLSGNGTGSTAGPQSTTRLQPSTTVTATSPSVPPVPVDGNPPILYEYSGQEVYDFWLEFNRCRLGETETDPATATMTVKIENDDLSLVSVNVIYPAEYGVENEEMGRRGGITLSPGPDPTAGMSLQIIWERSGVQTLAIYPPEQVQRAFQEDGEPCR